MGPDDVDEALPKFFEFNPEVVVIISPNTALPGPSKAREAVAMRKIPGIVITDSPGKKVKGDIEKQGLGYIIITGDPMIGARKEFLDPIEMALFNSNVNKVLAITGVYRIVYQEIDKVIYAVEAGVPPILPKIVIDLPMIRDQIFFNNPYAKAKAIAAYGMAEKVADIDVQACFIEKENEKYIPLVAAAHEIAQAAARLAEEAREIEKYTDQLLRKPHAKDGKLKYKTSLMAPPTFDEESYSQNNP
jgi:methylenetetrahydromethanopterin dehydrogenase